MFQAREGHVWRTRSDQHLSLSPPDPGESSVYLGIEWKREGRKERCGRSEQKSGHEAFFMHGKSLNFITRAKGCHCGFQEGKCYDQMYILEALILLQ